MLQVVSPQLLCLCLVRAAVVLLGRCAAGWHGDLSTDAGDTALVVLRRTHRIHSDGGVPANPSPAAAARPLSTTGAVSPAARCAAASAFFARLRSRRSRSATSRSRFACVCCFLAIRPPF